MPKKYTKTDDGWIQVQEDDEQSIDDLVKEIDMLISDRPANPIQETQRFQPIDDVRLHNATYDKAEKIHDNAIDTKQKVSKQTTKKTKTKKPKSRRTLENWEKQATRDAWWCLLFTFGSIGLIFGILGLCVWFGPLTWDGIGEAVVVFILKALWWAYETFYNMCVSVFEWILIKTNGII